MDEIERAQDAVAERVETERLTEVEREAHERNEAVIQQHLGSYIEVGAALAEIRQFRTYRETHPTFEAYCRERWDLTARYANLTIRASETARSLPVGTIVPTTESQARELVGLDPEQAVEVMHAAQEATEGRVTAAAIKEARQRFEVEDEDLLGTPEVKEDDPALEDDLNALVNLQMAERKILKRLAGKPLPPAGSHRHEFMLAYASERREVAADIERTYAGVDQFDDGIQELLREEQTR